MSENRAFPTRDAMSSAVPWNGGDAPCEHDGGATRSGCTRFWRDSPCATTNARR